MMRSLTALRLVNQQLEHPRFKEPGELVSWFGAVQGQEYANAKWSLGLRLPGSTDADIERAIVERRIVRSWPLRNTLHFVAAQDIRWMVALTGPRLIASNARRYRELELDERTLARSTRVIVDALEGGKTLTRTALLALLRQKGISTEGQRGVYMLNRPSLQGLVCQGAAERNNPTFMLIDEALPKTKVLTRDEARVELAHCYFQSHGPALLQDFMWWSGLPAADARAGLEGCKTQFESETVEGRTYWFTAPVTPARVSASTFFLLPTYDEYLIGYRDRSAALDVPLTELANGRLSPTIIHKGRVVGLWNRTFVRKQAMLTVEPFAALAPGQQRALATAARRYGKYLGMVATARTKVQSTPFGG